MYVSKPLQHLGAAKRASKVSQKEHKQGMPVKGCPYASESPL